MYMYAACVNHQRHPVIIICNKLKVTQMSPTCVITEWNSTSMLV